MSLFPAYSSEKYDIEQDVSIAKATDSSKSERKKQKKSKIGKNTRKKRLAQELQDYDDSHSNFSSFYMDSKGDRYLKYQIGSHEVFKTEVRFRKPLGIHESLNPRHRKSKAVRFFKKTLKRRCKSIDLKQFNPPASSEFISLKNAEDEVKREESSSSTSSLISKDKFLLQTESYNKRLAHAPSNVNLWLEYVEFQEISFGDDENKNNRNNVILDKQLAILKKSLSKNPHSLSLAMKQLEIGSHFYDQSTLKKLWLDLLRIHYTHHQLLIKFIDDFVLIHSKDVSEVIENFEFAITRLQEVRNSGTDLSAHHLETMFNLHTRLVKLLSCSGHMEHAISLTQSLIVYNMRNCCEEQPKEDGKSKWRQVPQQTTQLIKTNILFENQDDESEYSTDGKVSDQYSDLWLDMEIHRETSECLFVNDDSSNIEDVTDSLRIFDYKKHIHPFLFDYSSSEQLKDSNTSYYVIQFLLLLLQICRIPICGVSCFDPIPLVIAQLSLKTSTSSKQHKINFSFNDFKVMNFENQFKDLLLTNMNILSPSMTVVKPKVDMNKFLSMLLTRFVNDTGGWYNCVDEMRTLLKLLMLNSFTSCSASNVKDVKRFAKSYIMVNEDERSNLLYVQMVKCMFHFDKTRVNLSSCIKIIDMVSNNNMITNKLDTHLLYLSVMSTYESLSRHVMSSDSLLIDRKLSELCKKLQVSLSLDEMIGGITEKIDTLIRSNEEDEVFKILCETFCLIQKLILSRNSCSNRIRQFFDQILFPCCTNSKLIYWYTQVVNHFCCDLIRASSSENVVSKSDKIDHFTQIFIDDPISTFDLLVDSKNHENDLNLPISVFELSRWIKRMPSPLPSHSVMGITYLLFKRFLYFSSSNESDCSESASSNAYLYRTISFLRNHHCTMSPFLWRLLILLKFFNKLKSMKREIFLNTDNCQISLQSMMNEVDLEYINPALKAFPFHKNLYLDMIKHKVDVCRMFSVESDVCRSCVLDTTVQMMNEKGVRVRLLLQELDILLEDENG